MVGIKHVVLFAALIALFYGVKRLPELARGLGAGIRNFRASIQPPSDQPTEDEPPTSRSDS